VQFANRFQAKLSAAGRVNTNLAISLHKSQLSAIVQYALADSQNFGNPSIKQ
jgi:hypothetical protein